MECVDDGLKWYIDIIGESPCSTYDRLRRIGEPDYKLPNFNITKGIPVDPSTLPERCNAAECCCNSISFSLNMLCLTCKNGVTSVGSQQSGIDARPGTYKAYLNGCDLQRDRSLTPKIQTSVCQQDIKLLHGFWDRIWWDDGACAWTKEHTTSNDSSLFQCPPTLSTSSSNFPFPVPSDMEPEMSPSLSSSSSSSSTSRLQSGQIAGIIVGLTTFLVLAIVGWWLWWKRRFISRSKLRPRSYVYPRTPEPQPQTVERERGPAPLRGASYSQDADGYTTLSPGTSQVVTKDEERRRERLSYVPGPFLPVYER
ncbi:hypothetical protein WG66_012921 [Moniliophthora roreri]|nr:hypothetical protein WG66_012921 [Moniliophthora roreri]